MAVFRRFRKVLSVRKKTKKVVVQYDRTDLELVLAAVDGIIALKDKLPPMVVQSAYRQRRVLIWSLKHASEPQKPRGRHFGAP